MHPAERQEERTLMIREQLVQRGITDPRVLEALAAIPRHAFVSAAEQNRAYEDHPLPIACGQTISQPYMVALMTEMIAPGPEEHILEIGTGSGYQTALLASLAGHVVSVERHTALRREADERLRRLGYNNITLLEGDGSLGAPAQGPYDAILVTAGSPEAPTALSRQLKEGGRLVCPVGDRRLQHLMRITLRDGVLHQEQGLACVFVPLIGEQGWREVPPASPEKRP